MKKVYISGPMTGYENYNFDEFNKVATMLRAKGYFVINPADHGVVDGWSWSDYLRKDIGELLHADTVATLDGWEKSRGACLEVHIARELGMDVMSYQELLDL